MAVTPQDLKNVQKYTSYDEFSKDVRTDVVKHMNRAAELEMSWSQYCNFVCPEILIREKRNIMNKFAQDEGLFTRSSPLSKASMTTEFLEDPFRIALLQDILHNAYYNKRTAITMEADDAVGSPTLPFGEAQPAPVPGGLRMNPGELVASSTETGQDNYRPFKWAYDQTADSDEEKDGKRSLKRFNVAPGATIPASTLTQTKGQIQMEKWGNRFVLPYEVLTGTGTRVDKVAAMVRLEGLTEESRLFGELVDILENGDNTNGSKATVHKNTDFDGTADSFSVSALLAFLDEAFPAPFNATHVLFNKQEFRQFRNAVLALTGTNALENLNAVGLGPTFENAEGTTGIRYGRTPGDELDAKHILALDRRAAVEYVQRSGMAIRAQADNIANESREMVISDTYLWAKLAFEAVQVLDVEN
ncbi:MAG: hypothetical protein OXM61_16755 [Candidatus Poribacteria bacterium]|nr:hypothetical protein [Candidatus Poribacteria bacterium]